jgi:hypothetical protein
MQSGEFLRELWDPWTGEGAAVIWIPGTDGPRSIHVSVEDIKGWDANTEGEFSSLSAGLNVYTSPGLRRLGLPERGRGSQGTQNDVIALAGFVLDIDLSGGVHASDRLPSSEADVEGILSAGPDPTLVVSTGGGLHAWWLLERPFPTPGSEERRQAKNAFRAFQERFITAGEALGFHVDATSTIQHVFRLPGTQNWKRPVPEAVEVIYRDGPRYAWLDLKITNGLRVIEKAPILIPTSSPVSVAAPVPEGLVGDGLDDVRAWMRRVHPNHKNRALVDAALRGESLAEAGERDRALQSICSTIAWLSPARKKTAAQLAELLRPSLSVWASEERPDGKTRSLDDEIEKTVEKFDRAIEEREARDAEEAKSLAPIRRFLRREATSTEKDDVVSGPSLRNYAIIQHKNSFWAQSFGQQASYVIRPGYYGPFIQTELMVQVGALWENGPPQFSLTYTNDKGDEKAKTPVRVAQEYATGAHDVLGHFSLQESYFDPATRVFHEAICPIRPLEPRYDAQIDEWLRLMAGDQIDKLLDWITAITKLDFQCCALYLAGPKSCGKSVLANGLARLWHVGGATPLRNVMGNFNAEMFRCPLICLEEGLPEKYQSASSFLRELVGSSTHTYSQKHVVTRKVVGAIRLLICANNDNVLKFGDEEMSALDLEAVVGRFLHLRVHVDAAEWIDARNAERAMTSGWVDGDGIARHALWLARERGLDRGKRFLVEGETTAMHKALITSGNRNGAVLEWLVRFLDDPSKVESHYSGRQRMSRARAGNQQILVNTQAIVDCWELYLSEKSRITTTAAGRALNQLSSEDKPKLGRAKDRAHFHQVDVELVFSWAQENQIGNLDRMGEHLTRQLEYDDDPEVLP